MLFFNTVSSLLIKLLAICKCLSMQQRRKERLGLLVAMSMWTQLNSLNGRLSCSPVLIALFPVVICLEVVLHQTAHIWHSHHWLCIVVNTANGASLSRFGEVAFLLTLVQWKLAAILYVARPQRKSSLCSRKCRHFFLGCQKPCWMRNNVGEPRKEEMGLELPDLIVLKICDFSLFWLRNYT